MPILRRPTGALGIGQPGEALLGKALPPAADFHRVDVETLRDLLIGKTVGQRQDNLGAFDPTMFKRRFAQPILQCLTLGGRQFNGNSGTGYDYLQRLSRPFYHPSIINGNYRTYY